MSYNSTGQLNFRIIMALETAALVDEEDSSRRIAHSPTRDKQAFCFYKYHFLSITSQRSILTILVNYAAILNFVFLTTGSSLIPAYGHMVELFSLILQNLAHESFRVRDIPAWLTRVLSYNLDVSRDWDNRQPIIYGTSCTISFIWWGSVAKGGNNRYPFFIEKRGHSSIYIQIPRSFSPLQYLIYLPHIQKCNVNHSNASRYSPRNQEPTLPGSWNREIKQNN